MPYLSKLTKRLSLVGRTLALLSLVAGCSVTDAVTAPVDTNTPPDVADVGVLPESLGAKVGAKVRLTASVRDTRGQALQNQPISWSSTDPTIAWVDSTGLVTVVNVGTVDIQAATRGKSGRSKLTATLIAVASVSVTPAPVSVPVGRNTGLVATTLSSTDSVLTGRKVTWASNNATVATVDTTGLVVGRSAGTAQVSATSEGVIGTASVQVLAAPATVTDLGVTTIGDTTVTLRFTEVTDGIGGASKYVVRFAPSPISWATATTVTRGTCASPVAATTVGALRSCTVRGLAPSTAYQFQVVAFRGTIGVDAIEGTPSNIASATTKIVAIASVTVNPANASVVAGATSSFTATARDAAGNVLTGRALTWSSTTTAVATVSTSGVATGVTAGSTTIRATSGGVSGNATLTVGSATLQAVSLTPISVSLNSGATQQFSISGLLDNGSTTTPLVTYSATGGTITTGGLYTAGATAGTFRVIAVQQGGSLADTAVVTIAAPTLQAVILSPATVSLGTGATKQFAVSGQWSNGATTAPSVTYSATGGTVSAAGLYTAGTTGGTFRVIAVQQGGTLADTAVVTIAAPTLQAVILTPATVALNTGATKQFAVSGQWSNGATTAPSVTYSATGGTVSAAGLYTAGATAGTFRVIAVQQGGTLADTAVVTIAAPVLQAVILTPATVSMYTGATQQFGVSGQWSNGATTAPTVTYSATGGTVSAAGLYTAGATAGTFRVIAVQQGGTLADTSVVTVATAPAPGANPHEPAGMTVASSEAWNTSPNGRTGNDWITDGPGGNFSIVSDATAPKSPSSVLQVAYPAGFGAGYSPAQAYYAYNGGLPANTGTLYVRVWVKVSANWTDNGNAGTKFFFARPYAGEDGGSGAQTNHFISLTRFGYPDFGFLTQGPSYNDNYTDARLSKGVWHDIEILLTLGTSGSANDGTAKVWADGVLIQNLSGQKMLYNGQSVGRGWQYLFLDPTYGGGTNTPPANLNFQVDHWYVSVR